MSKSFKIFFLIFFCIFSGMKHVGSQTCQTATAICNGTNFTLTVNSATSIPVTLSVSNPTNDPFPPNSGCMKAGSPNPNWMIITISGAGNLGFSISDNNSPNPQSGFFDWILWPYSPTTCNDIFNNTLPPVRCNFNAIASGGTGIGTLPVGGNQGNYETALAVTSGQQFLLLMNNYNGVASLATFSSTGTALLDCSQVFNPDIVTCANKTETYTVNSYALSNVSFTLHPGNITQSSPVFTLSSPSTQVYTITSSGYSQNNTQPINYTSTFTYSVHTPPAMTVNNPGYFCNGSPVTFTVGPPGNYSVTMTSPLNTFSATFNTQQISTNIPPNSNGQYILTAIYPTGCTTPLATTINVSPVSSFPAGVTPPFICEGETFTLTANMPIPANFLWSGPNSFSAASASDSLTHSTLLQAGIYSVTASYNYGNIVCQKISTVTVAIDPCTGFTNLKNEEVIMGPNPANEFIYFSGLKNVTKIESVDFSGRSLKLKFNCTEIDLSNLKEGVYVLKFYKEKLLIFQKKIIILRC